MEGGKADPGVSSLSGQGDRGTVTSDPASGGGSVQRMGKLIPGLIGQALGER